MGRYERRVLLEYRKELRQPDVIRSWRPTPCAKVSGGYANMSVIVLYVGIGNLVSVECWLKRIPISYEVKRPGDKVKLSSDSTILLPGVGNSVEYVRRLHEWRVAEEIIKGKKFNKIIAICAGFQALCETVSEAGKTVKGMGLISGASTDELELRPHNGWSKIDFSAFRGPSPPTSVRRKEVFFNHSCFVTPLTGIDGFSMNKFGFADQYISGHIYGLQYHPEKSGGMGRLIGERLFDV